MALENLNPVLSMTEKLNNTKFLLSMNVKEFTKTCKHDILNENN